MDMTASAAHLPAPGETVIGNGFTMVPGGKGNNQAVTCARQGAATAFVGRVGTDAFGDIVLEGLINEGIDVTHLGRDPDVATGIAHITLDASGQNFIIVVPRANHALTVGHIAEATAA